MTLSRLDLDGTGSPVGLVTRILKLEPSLPIPVPLEELCTAFDITAIQTLTTQGFEAALITDSVKSQGIILVAEGRSRPRRRFSIAHELGHFLIPTHRAGQAGFQCAPRDLAQGRPGSDDARVHMEFEANQFAGLLLVPPPKLRVELGKANAPDLEQVVGLARQFDVSKEVMARAYVEHSHQTIAVIIARHGTVVRSFRQKDTPWLAVQLGKKLPSGTIASRSWPLPGVITDADVCDPLVWLEPKDAARVEQMTEQVLGQQNGYALIMLHMVMADEDQDERLPSEGKWAPRW